MEITVRKLELTDIPEVVRIANQAFLEGGRLTSRFGLGLMEKLDAFPGWHTVAIVGETVVGFLVFYLKSESVGSISWIATHPDWQGKGVGKKLLDTLEARCRAEGFEKISIGTPYAGRFYAKHGYREVTPQYRMVYELQGRRIEAPAGVRVRVVDLEDLRAMLDMLDPELRAEFLRGFFQVYEREQDKAICIETEDGITGVLVGETDPYNYDLVRALFVHVEDPRSLGCLLDAFAYVCSKRGKRWIGFEPGSDVIRAELEARGWEEAHLPSWWVSYQFEKDLRIDQEGRILWSNSSA